MNHADRPNRYIQFHPLAYLVKLNIELTMANLIRKIAISAAAKRGNHGASVHHEFVYADSSGGGTHTAMELSSSNGRSDSRFEFEGEGIQKTQEVTVRSMPNPDMKGAMNDVDSMSNSSTKDESGSTTGPSDMDDESHLVQDPWQSGYRTKITTNNPHAIRREEV